MKGELSSYKNLLDDIKNRIRQGQLRANFSANAELLATYLDIGKMIHERQKHEGWGKGVIPRLANDLKNELAEVKGFSERNLKMMVQFYHEYSYLPSILQRPVAQIENQTISSLPLSKFKEQIGQPPVAQLQITEYQIDLIALTGWTHHIILIQKVKDTLTRFWYMQQTITNGWSRDTLVDMIKSNLHLRQGNAITNFDRTLPVPQSELAKQMLKDPYIFDFMTLATPFSERELDLELVKHVQQFLLELGSGFAFVGHQYKLEISDKDFYIDLLFYHLKMRRFVVIELKKGDFIPEYAGKMNFYCSAVDDILKHTTDQCTIGLILCQGKDKLFAEYTLRGINKPIGISEYELTRLLPDNLKGSLPSIEEIEEVLGSNQNSD
ncbi:MAG: PDDEXK nuclease domain-containing protein [Bacteroidota bacterium]